MKRNGSIMIFVLITFMLISTTALLIVFMAKEQIEISNNSITNIQSQYFAESKINRGFYDNKYFDEYIYPRIINHDININYSFNIEKADLLLDSNRIVNFKFYNLDGKRNIELSAKSDYKGKIVKMKAYGPIYNDIFYDNNPALSYNTINKEDIEKFQDFMDEISDMIDIETFPKGNNKKPLKLTNVDYVKMEEQTSQNYSIVTKFYSDEEYRKENFKYDDEIFMVIQNPYYNPRPTLYIDDYVYFRGIVYIEGDLVISSNFRCLGFIIVNGDIIIDKELDTKPLIEGILAYKGELDLNDWDLKHHVTYISRYGIYLPNFIEAKLQVYRIME